jgi:hypothetical protein
MTSLGMIRIRLEDTLVRFSGPTKTTGLMMINGIFENSSFFLDSANFFGGIIQGNSLFALF